STGARGPGTFHPLIAPLLLAHCAPCHHPGGPAPFALGTYADAKPRAGQIADLTRRRLMPPWLPEPGCGDFSGDRSLSAPQIALIRQWVDAGALEGTATGPLPAPTWTEGWRLGEPSLVVTLPEPYSVASEGSDIYRNFVMPI